MSLSQALNIATAGLRVTQASLAVVAGNVANAGTLGYVRKSPNQIPIALGEFGSSVRIAGINRELDLYLQRQLRIEASGASYAGMRAQLYGRLQQVYGEPGSEGALETVFGRLTEALQALTTSPESTATRSTVLGAAQVLAQQLNGMTVDVQGLRLEAELGLSDAVAQANEAMQQIAKLNQQLGASASIDATAAVLLDQRDNYINQLSQLMDIRVIAGDHNQVSVFTNSGVQLVANEASQLQFDASGTITPASVWSADPTKRSVGTVTLVSPNGAAMDLLANNAIRSGTIAAYVEMRDRILPEAQRQLDEIAAALASALSDRTTDGTAVTIGAQQGFDLDVGGLLPGNRIEISYTDNTTATQHKVTIVRVDDPAALPLAGTATPDPNDTVVGVDFSGGMASVVAQLNAALGATSLQFSNPAGSTLRVLDDGGPNLVDVDAASTSATMTTLTGGSAELPFFLDGTVPFTGAITADGLQSTGLAGRIVVNPALIADPSRLVLYQTAPLTPAGDATRPNFIYDRLTSASLDFSPQSGIGTPAAPFIGSLPSYLRQMISQQGDAAQGAKNLKEGQDIVVNSLQQRFNDNSGINIDTEMATLLKLQTAYGANARVMSTVRDLVDLLLKM
jgi:flagellar hook-associated protein 1